MQGTVTNTEDADKSINYPIFCSALRWRGKSSICVTATIMCDPTRGQAKGFRNPSLGQIRTLHIKSDPLQSKALYQAGSNPGWRTLYLVGSIASPSPSPHDVGSEPCPGWIQSRLEDPSPGQIPCRSGFLAVPPAGWAQLVTPHRPSKAAPKASQGTSPETPHSQKQKKTPEKWRQAGVSNPKVLVFIQTRAQHCSVPNAPTPCFFA